MTRSGLLTLAMGVLVLVGCAREEAMPVVEKDPEPTYNWEDDQAEIRELLRASTEAFNRGDLAGHLAIYDSSVTFMKPDGPRPGVAAIEADFREAYFVDGVPRQLLQIDQIAMRQLGADAALVTGRFVLFGGESEEQAGRFTTVWLRTPAGWRVIHDHSS